MSSSCVLPLPSCRVCPLSQLFVHPKTFEITDRKGANNKALMLYIQRLFARLVPVKPLRLASASDDEQVMWQWMAALGEVVHAAAPHTVARGGGVSCLHTHSAP